MNKYRLNQLAMAVLGALLLFFGARTIVNLAFEKPEAEKPGYEVAGKTPAKPSGEAAKPAGESEAQLDALLAKADPAKGAEVAKKCQICHSFDKGGPNLIGPDLYGVLGRDVASHEGFDYSPALKAKGGKWDYASINAMITNPGAYAPGTKMALFPGLPDAQQRADVLAFLRTKNAPAEPAKPEAAPSAETPPAPPPAAEAPPPPPPAAETPPAPPPAAETPAPSAEPAQPEAAPAAETPAAPSAETPAAPAETPPAEPSEPEHTEAMPSAETPAPSGEPVDASQPQPVYPDGPPSD
jgi:cytochrome c